MPFLGESFVIRSYTPEVWLLVEPVVYAGRTDLIVVPEDSRTDFATVPRVFTWLIPRYGVYTRAAILHDYLCEMVHRGSPIVTRRDADGLFRRVLRECGVSLVRRWLMWAAVRAASKMSDASLGDWVRLLVIAIPAVLLLAVPMAVVAAWSALFWLLEKV